MDSKLTPMMRQYLDIKKSHPGEILFFRMGDFYEMFLDDAVKASKILDIALTSRQNDVPMCGIPYHAADSYIARLIKAGERVAVCEQMETVPSAGNVVRREVVRIITPGTVIESNLLQTDGNNYLAAVIIDRERIGLAFIDISTGDFYLSSIEKSFDLFRGEMTRFNPTEAVLRESGLPDDGLYGDYIRNRGIPLYRINDWFYDTEYMGGIIREVFGLANLKGLGMDSDLEIITAGAILQYLRDTHRKAFAHLKHPHRIISSSYMILDEATIANLELVQNSVDGTRNRTLYSVLNYARTAMGKRTLERHLLQPLTDEGEIERRLDTVQYFHEFHDLCGRLQKMLSGIPDLERMISRMTLGKVFTRDYVALRDALRTAAEIRSLLLHQPQEDIKALAIRIADLTALADSLEAAVEEEPALSPEAGRVIRTGFNRELDRLYGLKQDARTWILEYQEEEKKKLSAPSLKVRYNRVVGYYIEVSKGQTGKVPEHYLRKQTLVGSERYTTEELQKFESDILSASDQIIRLENEELERLLAEVLSHRDKIQVLASALGELDFFCSLALSAVENRFTRPRFGSGGAMVVADGRHPVVEKYYTREVFIPNDIRLDTDENTVMIITGPNMSGKSTYIRMCAVIQLMAQVGSFVPAADAELSIVDRIFTRIGASDNISRGESTFLVEMNETAVIVNNATSRSLIVMDEVGRGTSTYDGLSIAWAIVEYIERYIKAKTLFATHYHELTALSGKKGIVNSNVMVKETVSGVEFLHKVLPGAADKSYGIHVARLAGIPKEITSRAEKILERLEKQSRQKSTAGQKEREEEAEQLEIFNAANHRVIQAVRNIDLDSITPLEALNELSRLKKIIE